MPTIKIHNATTGEVTEREMSGDELEQWQADILASQAKMEAAALAEAAKEAAEAKLAALGLTADDLKALGLGGN